MRCVHCGSEIPDTSTFCPKCGAKVVRSAPATQQGLPSSALAPGRHVMSTRAKMLYSVVAVLLLVGMGIVFMRSLPGGSHPVIKNQPEIGQSQDVDGTRRTMVPIPSRVENGFIIIALADVVENKMVSFTYEGKNKSVALMAYVNPEGKLVTSVAMCEPCNSKSFHTESHDLVCDNCGTRWNFSTLEGISGSCQKYPPDPIPSVIAGGEIRIRESTVENWKMRI